VSRQIVDLLKKAAECDRALLGATDTRQSEALLVVRDLWLALADQALDLSEDQFAAKVGILQRIHPIVLTLGRITTHWH
jgi:hypothetical protein